MKFGYCPRFISAAVIYIYMQKKVGFTIAVHFCKKVMVGGV